MKIAFAFFAKLSPVVLKTYSKESRCKAFRPKTINKSTIDFSNYSRLDDHFDPLPPPPPPPPPSSTAAAGGGGGGGGRVEGGGSNRERETQC